MSSVPLSDAAGLRGAVRRTGVVRVALAVLLLVLLGTIAALAGHARVRTLHLLPAGSTAIVVLDLSASVSQDTYSRIGATLSDLAASDGRYGLVVFSDTAYEALPPGVPASDLTPLVRYFTLPPQSQPGFAPSFPPNPWADTFTGGTRISAGMALAHTIAMSQRHRPLVVLISDLDDDPNDLASLAAIMAAYQRDHIPVRVVGLNPSLQDVALFQRLLGPGASVVQAPTLDQVPPQDVTPFPWTLAALAIVAALALALREAWSPRLEWADA
jgi:hypothetical protein